MATTVTSVSPAVPAKVSFLKKIGQVIGKILGIVAKDAAPIASQAAAVASVLLPQFAPEITMADNLVSNIAKQAIITEALAATASTPVPGQTKLDTVLANIGPEIDAWVASSFPGATAVSTAAKAGLVNAVVAISNEVEGKAAVPASTPAA